MRFSKSFFLIIFFSFFFFIFLPSKAHATVAGAITAGFSVPAGKADGDILMTQVINIGNPPDGINVVINGETINSTFMNVGDVFKVTNIQTGKSFTFDSDCSTKKMPPLNITKLLDHSVYDQYGIQNIKFEFINKCSNAKNIGSVYYLYMNGTELIPFLPTMIHAVPPIADFKQTDPQWGSDHLDNSLSCGTMYSFGCAVTSVADVFSSYGKLVLSNSSIQLNPGTLNNWLADTNNQGFSSCAIIWGNASPASSLGAPSIIFRNGSSDWPIGVQAIDTALSDGNLPIVGVYTNFGTHFLVVSKRLPDFNGKPDYKLIDPALYPFVANSIGNTDKSLNQVYGGFDKVFETVIYKKDSLPQNTLTIRGHSPIQLLITDPLGNETGYNESTHGISEYIPESAYGIEPGIAPVDGSSPAMGETKYFQQINPSIGDYTVQLIGVGNGEYALDFSKTDEQGHISVNEVHGVAQTGVTETYHIQNTLDATIPVLVKKNVTFQSLIANVNELFDLNLITQKSVANNLIRNVEQAEEASLAGNINKVLQNLDQFSSLLQREQGRKITEEASFALNDNVNFLKGQYNGLSN